MLAAVTGEDDRAGEGCRSGWSASGANSGVESVFGVRSSMVVPAMILRFFNREDVVAVAELP